MIGLLTNDLSAPYGSLARATAKYDYVYGLLAQLAEQQLFIWTAGVKMLSVCVSGLWMLTRVAQIVAAV